VANGQQGVLGVKFWAPLFITSMIAIGTASWALAGGRQGYLLKTVATSVEKQETRIHALERLGAGLDADVKNIKSTALRVEDKVDRILTGGTP